MRADETQLRESVAYKTLAWRHRHRRLGVFAIVAEIGGEPARAWVECSRCAAMFEFVCDEVWQLADGVERTDAGGSEGAAAIEAAH
jgi:hypothetical protein